MPIKRIQDELENELVRARLPLLGLVTKGAKKKVRGRNGKEIEVPTDLEYFRFVVKGARNEAEEKIILQKLEEVFGPRPKAITIIFPYAEPDSVFEAWQEEWGSGSGLKHRCDGEHVVLWYDEKTRRYIRNPKDENGNPMKCPGNCSPIGRLHFIIPHLGRYAEWVLTTTSIYDIATLTKQLHHYYQVLGNLTRVAFLLKRTKRQVHFYDKDGVRRSKDSWLLDLEIDPVSLHTLMANQLEENTLRALEQQRALPVFDEDVVEAEIVVDEETGEILEEKQEEERTETTRSNSLIDKYHALREHLNELAELAKKYDLPVEVVRLPAQPATGAVSKLFHDTAPKVREIEDGMRLAVRQKAANLGIDVPELPDPGMKPQLRLERWKEVFATMAAAEEGGT